MNSTCRCRRCRATIREAILATFHEHRRWMGYYTVLYLSRLGWVPAEFYRSVFDEMLRLGIILVSQSPDDEFPRYLSVRLCRVTATAGKRGGQ